jgi:uncharacterized protein
MASLITEIFTNNIFLTILLAGSISQIIKMLLFKFKYKQKNQFSNSFVFGGMPSVHSALVGSLTTIIFLTEGATTLFFVVLTFSFLILMDSIGVRRSVGEEGKAIEKIIKYGKMKVNKFHYVLGHNFTEIFVGLIIGFSSAVFVYNFI